MPVGSNSMMDDQEKLQALVYFAETMLLFIQECSNDERHIPQTSKAFCEEASKSIDSIKLRFNLD